MPACGSGSRYGGGLGVDALGAEMVATLQHKAPTIFDRFVELDEHRAGTFTRRQLQDALYSVNVPTTDAEIERVFQSMCRDSTTSDAINWSVHAAQLSVVAVLPRRLHGVLL